MSKSFEKTSRVRQLVPKTYHFDGYNELNCPNTRGRPLFTDNVISLGDYHLTTRIVDSSSISLEFSSVCSEGKILFKPYILTIDAYVNKLREAVQTGSDFISFKIIPENECFKSNSCKECWNSNEACTKLRERGCTPIFAAVSFHSSEVKEALASYFGITNKNQKTTGGNHMKNKNNLLGMNFELGLSKDPNITATLLGVAVKNPKTGSWYTFDAVRKTRKNLANLKLGSLPIMLLPTKVLVVGDLIKKDGDYYYVKAVGKESITLIGAADGVIREVLPEESLIPGMMLYTKVVAFDVNTLTTNSRENVGGNILAAICMMQWCKGSTDDFSLDNINDESFNGLGSYLQLMLATGGNFDNMFGDNANLGTMIALGATGNADSDNMAQMIVLSNLLGGNNKVNSPLAGILSTDTVSDANVTCTKCGAMFPEGTNFCTKCGGKTQAIATENVEVICEKCGKKYPADTNFCPECGGKTREISTTCRKCGATLREGAAFCHKCGAKTIQDTCPNCGRLIEADESFCPGCGTALTAEGAVDAPVADAPVVEDPKPKAPAKKKISTAKENSGA